MSDDSINVAVTTHSAECWQWHRACAAGGGRAVIEPTVYTAEYVWPVGGGPGETPMGEKFVRLAEYERLRALLDSDNDEAVAVVAEAEREARDSYWDATTPAERAATGVDGVSRHVARAVLAALRKEADQ